MDTMHQALSEAIAAVGGQAALAKAVGVSQPTVWYWVNKSRKAAAEYVLLIEAASGVSRSKLRHDLYPVGLSTIDEEPETRIVLCGECGLRTDDPQVALCQALDCPRAEREAA